MSSMLLYDYFAIHYEDTLLGILYAATYEVVNLGFHISVLGFHFADGCFILLDIGREVFVVSNLLNGEGSVNHAIALGLVVAKAGCLLKEESYLAVVLHHHGAV